MAQAAAQAEQVITDVIKLADAGVLDLQPSRAVVQKVLDTLDDAKPGDNTRVSGPQVHDARVAALCLQHGVTELWTVDRDFGRFPALTVRNPVVG